MSLLHPEVALHTGVQPAYGVLLHGPPGCGKTMLANAIAREVGLPFIPISAPSIVSENFTAREMSHEVKRICLEVYDLNLASTGGPSARTIVPSGPHLPGSSPSYHPKKDGL